MADPSTYEDKVRAQKLAHEQRQLTQTLETKMSRWEEVCSLIGLG